MTEVTAGMVKTCRRCGQVKSIASFHRTKKAVRKTARRVSAEKRTTLDGRDCTCRECKKRKTRRNQGRPPRQVYEESFALQRIGARGRANHSALLRRMRSQLLVLVRDLSVARASALGVTVDAIVYRDRYRRDPAFREYERNRQRIYKHANPEAVARWGDKRRKRAARQSDGTLTKEVVGILYAAAHLCPYCGIEMLPRDKALDHRIPLARGGAHSLGNVVVCCMDCNAEKRDMPYEAWLDRVAERAGVRAA